MMCSFLRFLFRWKEWPVNATFLGLLKALVNSASLPLWIVHASMSKNWCLVGVGVPAAFEIFEEKKLTLFSRGGSLRPWTIILSVYVGLDIFDQFSWRYIQEVKHSQHSFEFDLTMYSLSSTSQLLLLSSIPEEGW